MKQIKWQPDETHPFTSQSTSTTTTNNNNNNNKPLLLSLLSLFHNEKMTSFVLFIENLITIRNKKPIGFPIEMLYIPIYDAPNSSYTSQLNYRLIFLMYTYCIEFSCSTTIFEDFSHSQFAHRRSLIQIPIFILTILFNDILQSQGKHLFFQ